MIRSQTPFVPHTLQHLIDAHVFPTPLPEIAYNKMITDYEAVDDVEVSSITYESDGLLITGLCALPKTIHKGAHPVLIYNRGGSGEYGKLTLINVLRSMVPFARAGYLVFASNYRGNAGSEGVESFGDDDVHDVLNLLKIAKENAGFDGNNAFMLGHSRGGMMTFLAIKHGAAINAAIAIAPVTNVHDMAANAGMEERILKKRISGYADNPAKAITDRSVVDWPEAITVPTLLIHGDADKDVDVSHSKLLDERLTVAHKLVIIEGGNHALYRHWDAVLAECFDWLERYHA